MALSQRYQPAKPPNEAVTIGLDYSRVLPPGIGLASATIAGYTNTSPATPTSDLSFGSPATRGRLAWATVSGGTAGADYQIRWQATDSAGNIWPRTCLMLCAQTS